MTNYDKRIHISEYYNRKRRNAARISSCLISVSIIFSIFALTAPSYHHQMIAFPFSVAVWISVSLWSIHTSSGCDSSRIPLFQSFSKVSRDELWQNKLCRLMTVETDGNSLRGAVDKFCGSSPIGLISFGGPCITLSAIAVANSLAIGLLVTGTFFNLVALVLSVMFSSVAPTEKIRCGIIFVTLISLLLLIMTLVFYPLLGDSINANTFHISPIFSTFGGTSSLSTGYMVLCFACVWQILAAAGIVKILKSEFTADSNEQLILYREKHKLGRYRRGEENDENKYLVSDEESVMDAEDLFVTNTVLNDEIAAFEIKKMAFRELGFRL